MLARTSGASIEPLQAALHSMAPGPALEAHETLRERARIVAVLHAAAVTGNPGVLRRAGQSTRVTLDRCDAATGQLSWGMLTARTEWGEPPYELDVVVYNSIYRLRLPADAESHGRSMVSGLPTQLLRIRRRAHRRTAAPPGLRMEMGRPSRAASSFEVLDLCLDGVGLAVDAADRDDLLSPGWCSLRLELDRASEVLEFIGEVRHVTTDCEGRTRCGVRLTPRPEDASGWARFVSQRQHPTTTTCEDLLDPLWQLFDLSGYFHLAGQTGDSFEALRRTFGRTVQRTTPIPELFCQTAWSSERGVEATLSSMKSYRYAWQIHQLAKRPGEGPATSHVPGQILRDVFIRIYEHAQADPEGRWVISYLERATPFVDRSHVRFAEAMTATGLALSMPIRLMLAECADRCAPALEWFDIQPATDAEKQLLADTLARTRPSCYLDALDFTRERLEMHNICEHWDRHGLRRERAIFVARRHGQPLAALVLERGEPGTNLFSLLDSARIVPLAPFVQADKLVYPALLDEARRWFSRRGLESFTYLREDDDDSYAEACGLDDSPEADPHLWIVATRLLPELIEFICELTVGRMPNPRPPH